MTTRRFVIAVPVTAALCFAIGSPSPADPSKDNAGKGPNIAGQAEAKPKKDPGSDAVGQLALAHSLVKYGRQAGSPQALITAAEILAKVSTSQLKDEHTNKGDEKPAGASSQEKKRGQSHKDDPEALLDEAKTMATGDPHVAAVADKVARSIAAKASATEKPRGAVGGPKIGRIRVPAYSTTNITVRFRGGEPAQVALSGDGDTDLDLYVYDENGNLVAGDADYTDDCAASWNPRWTGDFLIRVRNRGSVYNDYVIITN